MSNDACYVEADPSGDQPVVCQTAAAWQRTDENLKREFKRIRRSLKVCALCEVVKGSCPVPGVVTLRAQIAQTLTDVLAEINAAGG